ncbi:MAG: elongation factor 3 [Sneathiella sp.]|uniref:ATP-binding cassette domain-containing protein n=1 Tax=Sneathiella sp. TaxID=1964365 RepID=UPI000C593F7E|nr:ATP-binding cassette domain-containing protein [Sneathiella sp.]MAL80228.1 elongation factor 3 [Sneathiella sp.]
MAAPILALKDARITFGGGDLFRDISLGIEPGMRIALVGRNGSGKSTLLKALAGDIELDGGERFVQSGIRVSYLRQQPPVSPGITVHEQVARGLWARAEEGDVGYLVDQMLEGVKLDGARLLDTLSGGEARRVALAEALVSEPDVLLLDEPTNHLDIDTILWLEEELKQFRGALMIISHDRQFLKNLTNRLFWLDRGKLRTHGKGFAAFEEWSEEILRREEVENKKLDKKIAEETEWSHKGITARRARNEGRIRALHRLRAERAERTAPTGNAKLNVKSGEKSGRMVIEARDIAMRFPDANGGEREVLKKFSTRIQRGDRVGIIGPNGAGKTTLLKILLGQLQPTEGSVTLGTNLTPAIFDQHREQLDPDVSLWDTLADPASGQLIVQGEVRHVVAYLRDFLFEEKQAKSPVSALSGGEKNRLLLARLLARSSNLLVLDEPTNDLDMETLDLLQDMLASYDGTLLVISHDRDFLDQLVTSTIVIEADGRASEYVGGYSDYMRARRADGEKTTTAAKPAKAKETADRPAAPRKKLSYKDQRDLDLLPGQIAATESKIAALEAALADPELFARDAAAFNKKAADLTRLQEEKDALETRWLELEILQEEISGG